jgi:hypothetical protein
MLNNIIDARFIIVNICQHITWSLLEPETENLVEVSTESGVKLVLLRNLNESEERVQDCVVFIFE